MSSRDRRDDAAFAEGIAEAGRLFWHLSTGWKAWLDARGKVVASVTLKRGGPGNWLCVVSAWDTVSVSWVVAFYTGTSPGEVLRGWLEAIQDGSLKWKADRFGTDRLEPSWLVKIET